MLMIKLHTIPFGIGPHLIYSRTKEANEKNIEDPVKSFKTSKNKKTKQNKFRFIFRLEKNEVIDKNKQQHPGWAWLSFR